MKPRNTVVLVIIAHVGLFLIWICMGGCDTARKESIRPRDVDLPPVIEEDMGERTTTVSDRTYRVIDDPVGRTTTDTTRTTRVSDSTRVATSWDRDSEIKYVVQQNDSIWKISRKFKVSQDELCDRNDIRDPSMIKVGRELYIPKKEGVTVDETPTVSTGGHADTTTAETGTIETDISVTGVETEETSTTGEVVDNPLEYTIDDTSGAASVSEAPGTTGSREYIIHEVISGDTVWKLSRTYGVKSDVIVELNSIKDPTKLQIGQRLKIPKAE